MAKDSVAARQLLYVGDERFPVKVYVLDSYVANFSSVGKGLDLAERTILENKDKLHDDAELAIAVVVGTDDDSNGYEVSIFTPIIVREGFDNRVYESYAIENGDDKIIESSFLYGDDIIILAAEEKLRRKKKDLQDYLNSWPDVEL